MPPSFTNWAMSLVVGERPKSKSSGKVAISAIISLFIRQSSQVLGYLCNMGHLQVLKVRSIAA
jgi:hypothetical protein